MILFINNVFDYRYIVFILRSPLFFVVVASPCGVFASKQQISQWMSVFDWIEGIASKSYGTHEESAKEQIFSIEIIGFIIIMHLRFNTHFAQLISFVLSRHFLAYIMLEWPNVALVSFLFLIVNYTISIAEMLCSVCVINSSERAN